MTNIVSYLPASNHEILIPDFDFSSYIAVDVLAWAITDKDDVLPVSINKVHHDDYALRRIGEPKVTLPYGEQFVDADAWLAACESRATYLDKVKQKLRFAAGTPR